MDQMYAMVIDYAQGMRMIPTTNYMADSTDLFAFGYSYFPR